jgi:hypothetical protein
LLLVAAVLRCPLESRHVGPIHSGRARELPERGEARLGADPRLANAQSPEYSGRAVAALAADPNVLAKTGRVLKVPELAREYGFTDVDGRRPPHD